MPQVYIVRDAKNKRIVGVFDKEGVQKFMNHATVIINDKIYKEGFGLVIDGYDVIFLNLNQEYSSLNKDIIEKTEVDNNV
jgi:hypothetical protein